ncbi:type 1 fimbrial protein [Serratia marcescens]|uniref:fimbrial protein n=1 Tax=Serratia marcescens TaxID=615 RepID=UPI0006509157|nr:fimbrial protein [Serratia marcescens]MBH3100420.1 type 1 fimbrial protein [Serratia marcescens]MBH3219712.1 type 1 fimbrial protein [Serratia marcescens]POP19979.1 type 1 fimbrial protein [Serratia marcescens]POP24333.1 type 1 fimbrial protein [Serratia marcescens]WLS88171.1 fimbrial protein [Serratia marcescens]
MDFRIKGIGAPCLLLMSFGCVSQVISASQGEGRVNMQGAIIETACAIATESREQLIDMKNTALTDIVGGANGKSVPFSIELVNCVVERADKSLPDWKQFQITFDGHADGEAFGVNGDISGVALKITDAAGNIARPGRPLPPMEIIPGNYRLNFTLALIANNRPLKAGSYFSSVRFKMDYY